MFGDFIDQVLLIILSVVIPPAVTWILARVKIMGFPKVDPSTWKTSLLNTVISIFLIGVFFWAYDGGRLPFSKAAVVQKTNNQFGLPYQNTSRRTMIVTMSAFNKGPGNTMCAAVADDVRKLPQYKERDCHNPATTVAAASFINVDHASTMTFVVPRGFWYNINKDGLPPTVLYWTESLL